MLHINYMASPSAGEVSTMLNWHVGFSLQTLFDFFLLFHSKPHPASRPLRGCCHFWVLGLVFVFLLGKRFFAFSSVSDISLNLTRYRLSALQLCKQRLHSRISKTADLYKSFFNPLTKPKAANQWEGGET